jgi:nicotinamidase-related amidase
MNYCPFENKWCDGYGCWLPPDRRAETAERTIIDEWNTIPVPAAPPLKSVMLDPQASALLILDIEVSICQSPRCLASIAKIRALLTKARGKSMLVVYSLIRNGNPADIFRQIAPAPDEPVVSSYVDKFYQTDLEKILQARNVKTLLITGYAANGAVLHTATAAAIRDYRVIIPVDCMPAPILYAEQYTAWHMLNSPGTRNRATLTQASLVSFGDP